MTAHGSTSDPAKRLVRCPSCGAGLRIRVELLGKRVQCPKCQHKWYTTGLEVNKTLPPPPTVHLDREPESSGRREAVKGLTGSSGFAAGSSYSAIGSVIMPAVDDNEPSRIAPAVAELSSKGPTGSSSAVGGVILPTESVEQPRKVPTLPPGGPTPAVGPNAGPTSAPGGSSSRIKRPKLDTAGSGSGSVARLAASSGSAGTTSSPTTVNSPSRSAPPPTGSPRPPRGGSRTIDGGSLTRGMTSVSQKPADGPASVPTASPPSSARPTSKWPSSSIVAVGGASRSGPSPQASAVEGLNPLVWLGKTLGQFTVRSFLGKGGMGTVYEGIDPLLDRPVAIKILSPTVANDPDALRRFLHEARSAARVAHPNLVSVYAAGQDHGVTFLAMELVRGRSCAERLKADGPCESAEATRIAMLAARGLAAAHAAGIIHRDVKPANLMIDKNGSVKVADFGLAKSADSGDSGVTKLGEIVGTPSYMSPEQCRGDKLTFHTDIYSLGATYFALLTGRPPFTAENHTGLMYKHVHEPVPDPRSLRPEVPASSRRVLRKSMAKTIAERYASAEEMADDLEALLNEIETGVANALVEMQEAIEVAASAVAAETGTGGKRSRLSTPQSEQMLTPANKPSVMAELAGGIDLDTSDAPTDPALPPAPQTSPSRAGSSARSGEVRRLEADSQEPGSPDLAGAAGSVRGPAGNRTSLRDSLVASDGSRLSLVRLGLVGAVAVPIVVALLWAMGMLTPPPEKPAPPPPPVVAPIVLFGPGDASAGPRLNRQAGWKLRDDHLVFEHGGPPPDGYIGLDVPETADFRLELEVQWPGKGKPDEALLEIVYRRAGSPPTECGVIFRPQPQADTPPEKGPMLYYRNEQQKQHFQPLLKGVRWGDQVWNVLTLEAIGRQHRVLINGEEVLSAEMPIVHRGRITARAEGATVRIRKWTLTLGRSSESP